MLSGWASQTTSTSTASSSSSLTTTSDFDDLLRTELTSEDLCLWDVEALMEYNVDPVIVAQVHLPQQQHQQHPLPPAPALAFAPAPLLLGEWVAAGLQGPPHPNYPPPLPLEPGQLVRPVLIDFECGDFKFTEPIEMTVQCLVTGKVFTTLIKCEHPIHFKAWQIHGISKRMLEHEPEFPAAVDCFSSGWPSLARIRRRSAFSSPTTRPSTCSTCSSGARQREHPLPRKLDLP